MDNIENRTVVSSRLIHAPASVVFNAFSDPEKLKHWWGPKGFTNTIEQFEFKRGGAWKFVMHHPNGTAYPNLSEFTQIIENQKIVFIHHEPIHRFEMTLGYETIGDQTKFSYTMVFDNEEVQKIKSFLLSANEENFDRLEQFINNKK